MVAIKNTPLARLRTGSIDLSAGNMRPVKGSNSTWTGWTEPADWGSSAGRGWPAVCSASAFAVAVFARLEMWLAGSMAASDRARW